MSTSLSSSFNVSVKASRSIGTQGVCLFSYRKKDGGIRRTTETLSRDIMDRYLDGVGGTLKGHRKSARSTSSAYFDLEKGEFRCFLWENFIGQEERYGL